MTQAERRLYLIRSLLNEKTEYQSLNVPRDAGEQRKLLRSLMNVRMPKVITRKIIIPLEIIFGIAKILTAHAVNHRT